MMDHRNFISSLPQKGKKAHQVFDERGVDAPSSLNSKVARVDRILGFDVVIPYGGELRKSPAYPALHRFATMDHLILATLLGENKKTGFSNGII